MPLLTRDGVALFFEQAGRGGPPVVLVHGWGCNHTFMAPQFVHFRSTHRIVAVDLRGHVQSDRPQQAYSIAAFADDLAWICRELTLEHPVLIGHSMGGAIAMELVAQRLPQKLSMHLPKTGLRSASCASQSRDRRAMRASRSRSTKRPACQRSRNGSHR
jgi:pimeloyl-ACP methyl ester carboxylesterase